MKDQILKLIETERLTPARFADEIGVQRSSISHILSGRNKPSYDFISKILSRFSGINAEWLITGKGNMIKNEQNPSKSAQSTDLFNTGVTKSKSEPFKQTITEKPTPINIIQNTTQLGSHQVSAKSNEISHVTNVNNIEHVFIFYKNGTFKSYTPEI